MALVGRLRDLFKNKARAFGQKLVLPESPLNRYHFHCPVSREKTYILEKADPINLEEILDDELFDAIR